MITQVILNKLIDKKNLNLTESKLLMEGMLNGRLTDSQIAAILTSLRMKGETVDEILGFITVMRKHMVKIKTPKLTIDVCGTGGDGKGTFNISTAVALVAAGANVPVAKHGNRGVSSLCGSADVLEVLGVDIHSTPQQAETMLQKTGFTFLFAPFYHPAMKFVGRVRKELKIRTVFNFLGPFVNPAQVRRQIIGVPNIKLAEKLAKVAVNLHYEHLLIVSSEDGLDEISLSAPTHIFEVKGKTVKKLVINPKDYGFRKVSLKKIKGGNANINSAIIRGILQGESGSKKDIVILNSAAALYVGGKVENILTGINLAAKSINEDKASQILTTVIEISKTLQ